MHLIPHWLRPPRAEAVEAEGRGASRQSTPAAPPGPAPNAIATPDPRDRPAHREPDDEFEGEGWSFWG